MSTIHILKKDHHVFPAGEKLRPKNEEELLLELPDLRGSKGLLME
jgi:hypothetical protein